jgi:hypothetical protein
MTTAYVVDLIFVAVALVAPIALMWRGRPVGLLLGVVTVWLVGVLDGVSLNRLDPAREPMWLDALWLLGGWLVGLLYCLPIFLSIYFWRRWQAAHGRGSRGG